MSGNIPWMVRWLSRAGILPRAAVVQLDAFNAPDVQAVIEGGLLAEKTCRVLDQLNPQVALIARMGQNLSQFGLSYSHMGFVVRSEVHQEWAVLHLINPKDAAHSAIFEEGIVNFYSDNPYKFEGCLLLLPDAVQAALKLRLAHLAQAMHCPHYSLTSYPWSLTSQNSNQWVIEVLASALGDLTASRDEAQQWLKAQGYEPSTLNISLPTQWAGPLLRDSIRFDDQPTEARRQGRIQTVTVDSVFNWLQGANSPFNGDARHARRLPLTLY